MPSPRSGPAALPARAPTGPAAACAGVRIAPGTDLRAAARAHGEGTVFCLEPGVHRLTRLVRPRSHQQFVGRAGAVVSGARPLRRWRRAGPGVWVATGQTQQSRPYGTCRSGTACAHNEWVYRDDRFLARVMRREDVAPGRFFFDHARDRIYVGDDPAGHRLEASVSRGGFGGVDASTAVGVVIRGLVVEKMANRAVWGAIKGGTGWVIEDNVVRLNHGMGIDHGTRARVVGNAVLANGESGIGSYLAEDTLVEDNEVAFNNVLAFTSGGDASKWTGTVRLTVRRNDFHDNFGNGIWLDGDNLDAVVEANRSTGNDGHGIQYEVSCAAEIRRNRLEDNGKAGIEVVASQDVEVYDNVIAGNGFGIRLWHQDRASDPGSGGNCRWTLRNTFVHDNVVSMARGYTGMATTIGRAAAPTRNRNRFEGNTYYLPKPDGRYFYWLGARHDQRQWRRLGQDRDGSFLVTAPGPTDRGGHGRDPA